MGKNFVDFYGMKTRNSHFETTKILPYKSYMVKLKLCSVISHYILTPMNFSMICRRHSVISKLAIIAKLSSKERGGIGGGGGRGVGGEGV